VSRTCLVEEPGGATEAERRQATVAKVPPLSIKSGANLGGKVELVGASVEPGRVVPGRAGPHHPVLQGAGPHRR
jgi:hypothetical protein